jgi:phosphoglycerate dehydrogenase-like enzyme
VLGASGRNAISVAEFTIAILLACCKNVAKVSYLLQHTDKLTGPAAGAAAGMGAAAPPSFWSTDTTGPAAR